MKGEGPVHRFEGGRVQTGMKGGGTSLTSMNNSHWYEGGIPLV